MGASDRHDRTRGNQAIQVVGKVIFQPVYTSMIRRIAYRIMRRLPRGVDLDELMSDGYFGLAQALARYDACKGRPFENFAAPRIRGAILDGLRTRNALRGRRREAIPTVSLSAVVDNTDLVAAKVSRGEMLESIRASMQGLARQARLILHLYYLEGLSMKQVGSCLGITEARVSQLHARIINNLRQRLAEPD